MNELYEKDIKCDLYMLSGAGKPRLSRISEVLLVAATEHMDMWGWEHGRLEQDYNVCLVIVGLRLELNGVLRLGESLHLKTWTGKRKFPIMQRFFTIANASGETVCEAVMQTVLMNIRTRTLVSDIQGLSLNAPPEPPEISVKRLSCGKLRLTDTAAELPEHSGSIKAEFSDLDYNGHVNTARYVDFIENLLGLSWFNEHCVRTLEVHYNRELMYGELCEIKAYEDNGELKFFGAVGGEERFDALVIV